MLSDKEFIICSIETNLFFLRISKEHSLFLEASFTPKNHELSSEANNFKNLFANLLARTISISDGIVSPEVLSSGELVTDFTLRAEMGTEFYTGIPIDKNITKMELGMTAGIRHEKNYTNPKLIEQILMLNHEAIAAATALAQFKSRILNDFLCCRIFTTNYPLLIDHIRRETRFYIMILTKLQNREQVNTIDAIIDQEIFWNRIMAEHSKFIRGLLDPSEVELFDMADNFGKEFDNLTSRAMTLNKNPEMIPAFTRENLNAANKIRAFKTNGTEGLINCKLKSIILPLLGDHVLREANHFARILNFCKKL